MNSTESSHLNVQLAQPTEKKTERGTAILEAALTLVMFFVVLFGIMEAGRFMSIQQTLTDAAREGARLSVAPLSGTNVLPTDAEIRAEVQRFLDSNSVDGASIVINPVTLATGDIMTRVNVTVPYQVLSLSMFSDLEIALSGTALMRQETSP